ncbi:hypothetical protein AVEN_34013-1 [Araneus ventricosus]|uniref:Uncharacterized protein n=1 Tax=Araneus ventricosus TaxID=182803 RepID=A0A4Y2TBL2_ARAVE|nr:hypothetical protein AVEN_34013-1 [Araneus ventricosus]
MSIAARLCKEEVPCSNGRGFLRWLQNSGETYVNDRRSKEVDGDLSTVPTGSCRLRMRLGSVFALFSSNLAYSTTRCSAGRITTAINPERRTWNI